MSTCRRRPWTRRTLDTRHTPTTGDRSPSRRWSGTPSSTTPGPTGTGTTSGSAGGLGSTWECRVSRRATYSGTRPHTTPASTYRPTSPDSHGNDRSLWGRDPSSTDTRSGTSFQSREPSFDGRRTSEFTGVLPSNWGGRWWWRGTVTGKSHRYNWSSTSVGTGRGGFGRGVACRSPRARYGSRTSSRGPYSEDRKWRTGTVFHEDGRGGSSSRSPRTSGTAPGSYRVGRPWTSRGR